jgi:5-(carboxyamino)imidazole ribonucleotide synthase
VAQAPPAAIPPGSVIGILGGGQLGRMTALAAARLGYRCHIFCPDADAPAVEVAAAATIAPYDDIAGAAKFAQTVDVVTIEFENIPEATLQRLAASKPVRPSPIALRVSQDRALEKRFANDAGIATAPWAEIDGPAELAAALTRIGRPAVLKTARLGYDGKGQARIGDRTDPDDAWSALGGVRAVLEGFVDFERELSVVLARRSDGEIAAYPPVENRHVDGILATTIAPARISAALAAEAVDVASRMATALNLVGLLATEMFVTRSGRLLVNEIAPRPHNSGHWTIDACATSQFEQLVRAICGLPFGSMERRADAVMTNLLGRDIDRWPELLAEADARLHLYGKRDPRPGRKMGHVTRLYPIGSLGAEDPDGAIWQA